MKGFPKTINTGQDLFNCLALVQAGELPTHEMKAAIAGIEARAVIACPILSASADRKTIRVRYCAEAEEGQKIGNAAGSKITGVKHINDSGEGAEGNNAPEATEITLSKAIGAEETVLYVPASVNPLDEMGITEEQFNSVKVVLESYE